jgi:carboxypeptidase T
MKLFNTKSLLRFSLIGILVAGVGQTGLTQHKPRLVEQNTIRYVIQTQYQNPYQLAQLGRWLTANNFDVAGMNWRKGRIEVVTNQSGIQFLKTKGINGFVMTAPPGTQQQIGKPDKRFLNPTTLAAKMKAINEAYPQLTRLEQIGTSIQGRPILALLVSSTPQAGDPKALEKPTIIFDGLHHAREIMTPEIVLDVAETLLKGARVNQRARQLLQGWNVWLVPMLNLDGSNIVWTDNGMWRKNAHADGEGIHGVDLNRNYTFKWNGCGGSSGSKSSETYRGAAPNSEPETHALIKLADRVKPTASLSYHSYSELVLYSYGCKGDLTGDKQLVEKVARELAALLPSDDRQGNYTPGAPWQILYAVDGASMDHMHAYHGALAYTFEVNQDFHPPYELREPTLVKHRKAWIYFLNRMDKNMLTVTTVDGRARTGKPTSALIAINTIPHVKGELPFRSNEVGKFFKVLDPGTYIVSAKLADGRTAQAQVQMTGNPQEVTITIP